MMLKTLLRAGAIGFVVIVAVGLPTSAAAGGDWNDSGINWRGYEEGLAEAKEAGKPVCLVFYTDWCPHCAKYSGVFHDDKVVEQAKKFVTIRVNKEEHAAISAKYVVDGEYIPRTYFLSSAGELDPDIHEQRDKYRYFYDTVRAGGLLRGMGEALEKLGGKKTSEGDDS